MCHVCGSESTNFGDGHCCCQNYSLPFCGNCKKYIISSGSDGEEPVCSCKFCLMKSQQEIAGGDGFTPYATPLTTPLVSPASSLSSYKSCLSSWGDFSDDMNFLSCRDDGDEGARDDTCQEDHKLGFIRESEEQLDGNLPKSLDNLSLAMPMDQTDKKLDPGEVEKSENSNSDDISISQSELSIEVQFIRSGEDSEGTENAVNATSQSPVLPEEGTALAQSFDIEINDLILMPPEPENIEDDIECSVANNDDDDEYNTGTKWESFFSRENGDVYRSKEERQKAMAAVMSGHFRAVVEQLLVSEGIGLGNEVAGEGWLEIVSILACDAASLIKPDANEGSAMNPGSYVKVKCISSGSRSQSEVIRGVVFKKNAAHKHMPTRYKNPKLLLFQGVLGQHASGLSSFEAMEEENNYKKSMVEMLETCHPDVVLVEKNASRDMLEFLLLKGITLVLDMKLPRLERLAACTGLQILSTSDSLMKPKLKQCDSFHIEKIVEEHGSAGENGKQLKKTLMFFEGCPKPMGCTILLKGAHADELKKVKHVVQYAVFAAYHLILETSFLIDQRILFSPTSSVSVENGISTEGHIPFSGFDSTLDSNIASPEGSAEVASAQSSILIPQGFQENNHHKPNETYHNQQETSEASPPALSGLLLSSFSASLKKVLKEGFPRVPSPSYQSISMYFGFKENKPDNLNTGELAISPTLEALGSETGAGGVLYQAQSHDNIFDGENNEPSLACCEVSKVQIPLADSIKPVWDPHIILILFSSRCVSKGIVCERSHLSRIQFYGNFDKSLGRFLHDNLLNQGNCCSTCSEPPEAHVYCYTHQNGMLTVYVKRLPKGFCLPGEAEGKLWMWARCLKCVRGNGIPKSTRRVVMSAAACGLSFGKFLELSFSNNTVSGGLSSCSHSLHRDCLCFYGLGSMVAVFSYSPIDIYTAHMPPRVLGFCDSNGQEWLRNEAKYVFEKGNLLFTEVANSLQKLLRQSVKPPSSIKKLFEVEEMLRQEKSDFEKTIAMYGQQRQDAHGILDLNNLVRQLVLHSYVWDLRFNSLVISTRDYNTTRDIKHGNSSPLQNDSTAARNIEGQRSENNRENLDEVRLIGSENLEVESNLHPDATHCLIGESLVGGKFSGSTGEIASASISDHQENYLPISRLVLAEQAIPDNSGLLEQPETATGLDLNTEETVDGLSSGWTHENSKLVESNSGVFSDKLEDSESWIWLPFQESYKAYRRDLRRGYKPKFDFINGYIPAYLSSASQLISQEGLRLCFPVGTSDGVVSVYEDEITSIIACALTLSQNQIKLKEILAEKEICRDRDGETERVAEKLDGFPYFSWNGSLDSIEIPIEGTVSSEELSTSGSEGSFLDNTLLYSQMLHPEFSFEDGRSPGKGKYSVVCIYAEQFYALRRRCCPMELDYISSLSRCKKWDAQGGKSKVFFAKTLDDRFIVKQLKKTEVESFLKFGPAYFEHIIHSLSSGSQTCLAKILGIYQISIKQTKGGKDLKIDVMVMENLVFGRRISCLYDLKGALYSRYTSEAKGTEKVMLDQNFVEDMLHSPFFVDRKAKQLLIRAVWNDTSFLTSINVMDYSLLVGVDSERHELVFGIIDYLRQYTWDKHLETWVKASLVPRNSLPTVISPKEYKKRFRKFMSTHFMTVPAVWCPKRASDLEFSADGDDSPQSNDADPTENI